MRRVLAPLARRGLLVIAIAIITVGGPQLAVATPAQQQRDVSRSFAASADMTIELENLAGTITLEGVSGGQIEVAATIQTEDGGGADAQALLGLIEIEFESTNDELGITVNYPVGRYNRFHYPSEGRGTTRTTTRYQGERIVVTSDEDDAVKVWVDFVIRVPQGVSANIENIVGNVTANGLGGDLSVDTHTGHVIVAGGTGAVEADTGSGDVRVSNRDGDVSADTGSGDVEISNINGDVSADTGSGDIIVIGVEGGRIEADTGSGDVRLERVSGSLTADTGSGDIEAVDLRAGAVLSFDTGSGDVRLSGDMSEVEEIEIDTGSGDVELNMSAAPGMRITIDTGNGSINVDLPNLRTLTSRRTFFRGEVGDGSAQVNISTGNGNVRIRAG